MERIQELGRYTGSIILHGLHQHPPAPFGPLLIMLSGCPGSGKSHLAQALSRDLKAWVVSSDRIRMLLFAKPRYTPKEHEIVHATCHYLTRVALQHHQVVIADATNLRRSDRKAYEQDAESLNAKMLIVVVDTKESVILERLQRRSQHLVVDGSEADESVYYDMHHRAMAISEPHIVVHGDGDVKQSVAHIRQAIVHLTAFTHEEDITPSPRFVSTQFA
jgi:predicted kinase